jgi:ribosomal protein S27E
MEYKFHTIIIKGRKYFVTKLKCIDCKKERIVFKDNLYKSLYSGRCKHCNAIHNIPKVNSGSKNINWKGGRRKMNTGYVIIWLDKNDPFYQMAHANGYVLEHRYLIAKKLGRCLKEFEQVHHLNGKVDDNRLENLQLINGSVHNLITKMQTRINFLERELKKYVNTKVLYPTHSNKKII